MPPERTARAKPVKFQRSLGGQKSKKKKASRFEIQRIREEE